MGAGLQKLGRERWRDVGRSKKRKDRRHFKVVLEDKTGQRQDRGIDTMLPVVWDFG